MNGFLSIKEHGYPDENKTCWLYNETTKHIAIGCYVYVANEGWFWGVSTNDFYVENNEIITEALLDDEYEFTHYCYAPKLS